MNSTVISVIKSGLEVIKLFSRSTQHEVFSANKYENANNSWYFHIYLKRNFHAQLRLARNNL